MATRSNSVRYYWYRVRIPSLPALQNYLYIGIPFPRHRSSCRTSSRSPGRRTGTRWCRSCTWTWRCPGECRCSPPRWSAPRWWGRTRQRPHQRCAKGIIIRAGHIALWNRSIALCSWGNEQFKKKSEERRAYWQLKFWAVCSWAI